MSKVKKVRTNQQYGQELFESLELLAYEHVRDKVNEEDGLAKAIFLLRHTGFVVNGDDDAEALKQELRSHYTKKYNYYSGGGKLPEHLKGREIPPDEDELELRKQLTRRAS